MKAVNLPKIRKESTTAIKLHYKEYFRLYEIWSGRKDGGYHFGFPKRFSDIFNNSRMVLNLNEYIATLLSLSPGKQWKILDAGCGTGSVARFIAKETQYKTLVYGVTISAEQCAKGRHINQECGITGVELMTENYEHLPFPDSFFDHIYFVDSLCYGTGTGKEQALKEAWRVLKPGGSIVISDVFLRSHPLTWNRFTNYINNAILSFWAVSEWGIDEDIRRTVRNLGGTDWSERNMRWLIVPSVLHMGFSCLWKSLLNACRDASYWREVGAFLFLTLSTPLLGVHPDFQYKVVKIQKSLDP